MVFLKRMAERAGYGTQRGQNLIEFAIVLPVFLLILMGVIDFGFMLKMQTDLTRANAAGARTAAFAASDEEVHDSIMLSIPDRFDSSRLSISLTREVDDPERGTEVTVESSYLYESVTPLPVISAMLNNLELVASATVRVE